MADRVMTGPQESPASIREAVCINTRKIFDSCLDKDCVDDIRVYPTESSQNYIENALSVRPKNAQLLQVEVNQFVHLRHGAPVHLAAQVLVQYGDDVGSVLGMQQLPGDIVVFKLGVGECVRYNRHGAPVGLSANRF